MATEASNEQTSSTSLLLARRNFSLRLTVPKRSFEQELPAGSPTSTVATSPGRRSNTDDGLDTPNWSPLIRVTQNLSETITKSPITTNEQPHSPISLNPTSRLGRRLSSLCTISQSKRRFSKEEFQKRGAQDLEEYLQNLENRDELADYLLGLHLTDACSNLRFACAVISFEKTTDLKQRKLKSRKIVSLFLEPTSSFYLKSFPNELFAPELLIPSKLEETLVIGKFFALTELMKNSLVKEFLSKEDI